MSRKDNSRKPVTLGEDTLPDYGEMDQDQDKIKQRLMETLRRESINLLSESAEGRLEKDRSTALIGYLKYFLSLEDAQKSQLDDLTDDDIKKGLGDE